MQVLATQLHFLANRNAGLAIPPLFWQVNCIKIGGHVALLSGPTVHSPYCATALSFEGFIITMALALPKETIKAARLSILVVRGLPTS